MTSDETRLVRRRAGRTGTTCTAREGSVDGARACVCVCVCVRLQRVLERLVGTVHPPIPKPERTFEIRSTVSRMTMAGASRPPPLLLSRLDKQLSPPRRRQRSPLKSSPSHRYNFEDGSPVKVGSPLLRYSPIQAAGSLAAARAASSAALLSPFRRHRRGGSPLKRVAASPNRVLASPSGRVLASPNRVVASPARSIKSAQISVFSGRQWQTCTADLYSDGKLRYAVLAPGGGTASVHMLHVDDDVAFVQLDDVERTFELRLRTGRKATMPRQQQPTGSSAGGLARSGSSGYLTQGLPIKFRVGSVAELLGWVRALRSQRVTDFRPEASLHAIEEMVRAEERAEAERAAVFVLASRALRRLGSRNSVPPAEAHASLSLSLVHSPSSPSHTPHRPTPLSRVLRTPLTPEPAVPAPGTGAKARAAKAKAEQAKRLAEAELAAATRPPHRLAAGRAALPGQRSVIAREAASNIGPTMQLASMALSRQQSMSKFASPTPVEKAARRLRAYVKVRGEEDPRRFFNDDTPPRYAK